MNTFEPRLTAGNWNHRKHKTADNRAGKTAEVLLQLLWKLHAHIHMPTTEKLQEYCDFHRDWEIWNTVPACLCSHKCTWLPLLCERSLEHSSPFLFMSLAWGIPPIAFLYFNVSDQGHGLGILLSNWLFSNNNWKYIWTQKSRHLWATNS